MKWRPGDNFQSDPLKPGVWHISQDHTRVMVFLGTNYTGPFHERIVSEECKSACRPATEAELLVLRLEGCIVPDGETR